MTAWEGLARSQKQHSVPGWIAVVVVVLVVAFGVAAAGFLLTVRQIEDSFTRVMVSRADRLGVRRPGPRLSRSSAPSGSCA
jgi:hypothetical protein